MGVESFAHENAHSKSMHVLAHFENEHMCLLSHVRDVLSHEGNISVTETNPMHDISKA